MKLRFVLVALAGLWIAMAGLPGGFGSRATVQRNAPPIQPVFPNPGGIGTVTLPGSGGASRYADPRALAPGNVWVELGLPAYAPMLGVQPGHYSEWYGLESRATVHVVRAPVVPGGARTVTSYGPEITAAVLEFETRDKALEAMDAGMTRFRVRDYAGAAAAFVKAAPLAPDNALPHFSLGHALFALGAYEDAAYQLRRGFELMPQWLNSALRLQDLYGEPRDLKDQCAALRAHRTIHPEDVDATLVSAYVSLFVGDLDGAATTFERLTKSDTDRSLAQAALAEIARIRARAETESPVGK
ncbi:MAG: hypothetical protein IPH13_22745 [Planctomycetes bacterium]|nr:hypothetical protein [Planctomycetota bacterium]MCC7172237.1 hypothetical protein [Planctomycetota bacterium]